MNGTVKRKILVQMFLYHVGVENCFSFYNGLVLSYLHTHDTRGHLRGVLVDVVSVVHLYAHDIQNHLRGVHAFGH